MLTSAAMKRIKQGHMKFLKRDIFYLSVLTLVKPNGCLFLSPLQERNYISKINLRY